MTERITSEIDAADMSVWVGLIEETQQALATLRLDELEALAERAGKLFASTPDRPLVAEPAGMSSLGKGDATMRLLAGRHRILGDLLYATSRNIAVLQQLQGQEVNAQWEH